MACVCRGHGRVDDCSGDGVSDGCRGLVRHADRGVDPVPWSAVASRQTGIYASVDDLDQGTVDRTVDAVCDGCVRCPAWRETGDDGTTIPCLEPCSFLVAAAREFDAHGATADTDSLHSSEDVERGDLTDPANRYRVRYSRQASKLTQK
ncbi:hypothetical protein [Halovenus salina]|uniref:DR2241 4Fe-4S iron-sulfur cluster binding domain-containing protein n=1 Tax=Halovenus salina TaxID=1510225 RepID=A0ABD5VZ75_9EURY